MLRFWQDTTPSESKALFHSWDVSIGFAPASSVYFPAYWPGRTLANVLELRSSADRLKTSPSRRLGLHACFNLQVDADVYLRPSGIGVGASDYDPCGSLAADSILQPASDLGYSIEQIMSHSSPIYWREGNALLGMSSRPWIGVLTEGSSWERCYGSRTSTKEIQTTSCVWGYTLNKLGSSRYVVSRLCVAIHRHFSLLGVPTSTFGSAIYYVETYGPRNAGSTVLYHLFLSPSNGWQSRDAQYPLPDGLVSSPSFSVALDYLEHPDRACVPFTTAPGAPVFSENYVPPTPVKLVYPASALGDAVSDCDQLAYRDSWHLSTHPAVVDWAELGDEAADGVQTISINSLAYIAQFNQIFGTLRSTFALLGAPQDPEKWASWWLSLRYGDRLTFNDTSSIVKALGSQLRTMSTGWRRDFYKVICRGTPISLPLDPPYKSIDASPCLGLYYRPRFSGWFPDLYRMLDRWDLWPTLENAWDLIPFSFVVDWFVNVQDGLASVDRSNRLLMLDVLAVTESIRTVLHAWPITTDTMSVCNWTVVQYTRDTQPSLPTAPFRIDRGHLSAINIVDGISLLYAG